jgi:hypothetical protein
MSVIPEMHQLLESSGGSLAQQVLAKLKPKFAGSKQGEKLSVSGAKLTIKAPWATYVWTIRDDGSLTQPTGRRSKGGTDPAKLANSIMNGFHRLSDD